MNEMFGLTKPQLIALGTPDAQAELDRRAAKKAAKLKVTNLDQPFEESQEIAMGKAALDALVGIGDVQEMIINMRDASTDETLRDALQTVGNAIDEALAGLPMFVAGHKIR